ncbi:Hypp9497, partial [Branchiostoma lanceolatum]
MEEEFDPDVMVVESTAVYLQCVKEQPPEISCKPGPPRSLSEASWEESWKAMEELHKEGKIRSLGVSNFFPKHLKKLVSMAEVPVSLVQNWFDPIFRD